MFPRLSELTAAVAQPVAEETLVEGRSDMTELIEKYCDQNKLYNFEGPSGQRKFLKIVSVLGYRDMDSFLEDNSGAIQAMLEWLGTQRNTEWVEALEAEVGPSDDDSDEDDEDK